MTEFIDIKEYISKLENNDIFNIYINTNISTTPQIYDTCPTHYYMAYLTKLQQKYKYTTEKSESYCDIKKQNNKYVKTSYKNIKSTLTTILCTIVEKEVTSDEFPILNEYEIEDEIIKFKLDYIEINFIKSHSIMISGKINNNNKNKILESINAEFFL